MTRKERRDDFASEADFLAAIDETIQYFNDDDDDIVEGTVAKVNRDEVLVDLGYQTEGVIPASELSIEPEVDPLDLVNVGDKVEALVLQKEDEQGRLILSRKRVQYERARVTIEHAPTSELNDLRKQLAVKEEVLRAEEARWGRASLEREGELEELRAAADRYMREGEESRSIARGLWAAMPPEGRLAYFESDSSWLPEWIVGKSE